MHVIFMFQFVDWLTKLTSTTVPVRMVHGTTTPVIHWTAWTVIISSSQSIRSPWKTWHSRTTWTDACHQVMSISSKYTRSAMPNPIHLLKWVKCSSKSTTYTTSCQSPKCYKVCHVVQRGLALLPIVSISISWCLWLIENKWWRCVLFGTV